MDIRDIPLTTIDGDAASLADFDDRVVMVVNVASRCGLTPQYEKLEALQREFGDRGFTVLGFPCNQFAGQEPGDAEDITTPRGHAFAVRLLDHLRARIVAFQDQTGHMYNLEATPAEGTTYRFAKEDRKRWPDILQAGTPEMPYYTNSSQLPVGFTDDPFEALTRQEELQTKYTGGTVLHLYMSEKISSPETCKALVRRSLERFRLPYITITPTFSICPQHGYLDGEHEFCPKCDEERLAEKRRKLAA